MANVISASTNTVPITQFNRGYAGKIFEDVKKSGAKVVMKNNSAECILLSPDEYLKIMDELNDMRLLAIANQRMLNSDPAAWVSDEEMNRRLAAFHWEFPSKDYPRYLNLFVQNVGSMAKGGIWETK